MEIITIKNDVGFDPQDLAIYRDDLSAIIVACPENNETVLVDETGVSFIAGRNIEFFDKTNHPLYNELKMKFNPTTKIRTPKGIDISFKEPDNEHPYYEDVFCNIIKDYTADRVYLRKMTFDIYFKQSRLDGRNRIKKNQKVIQLNFNYNMFAESQISRIIIIENNFAYDRMSDHF